MSNELARIHQTDLVWGIYDKADNCWIGNDDGPRLFDDHIIARMAAQVIECAVYGTDLGCKYEARIYPKAPVRLRDKVDLKLTPLKALERIEGGADDDQKESLDIEVSSEQVCAIQ